MDLDVRIRARVSMAGGFCVCVCQTGFLRIHVGGAHGGTTISYSVVWLFRFQPWDLT